MEKREATCREMQTPGSEMKNGRLDSLIWTLIYGGLFMVMLGLWVMSADAALGHGLTWAGALLVAVGVLLIWLRSRRKEDGPQDKRRDR